MALVLAVIFASRYLLGERDHVHTSEESNKGRETKRKSSCELRTCKSESDLSGIHNRRRKRTRSEYYPDPSAPERSADGNDADGENTTLEDCLHPRSRPHGIRSLEDCKLLLKEPVCTIVVRTILRLYSGFHMTKWQVVSATPEQVTNLPFHLTLEISLSSIIITVIVGIIDIIIIIITAKQLSHATSGLMECTTVSLWMSGWCVLPVWWGSVFVGWHQECAHAPAGEDSQGPTAGSGYQVMLWNPISDRTHLSNTLGRNIWTSTGWSTSFPSAGILAARILVQNGAKQCPAHKTMFMMPVILCRRSLVSKKLAVSSALENLPYECYDYSSVSIHSNTMKRRTFVAMDMRLSESPDKISPPVQAPFA